MSHQYLIITQTTLVLAKQQESLTVVNQGSQSISIAPTGKPQQWLGMLN
jgi:hypothetical protein